MPYLSASDEVMIHYEEALYQVYGPLPLPLNRRDGLTVDYRQAPMRSRGGHHAGRAPAS